MNPADIQRNMMIEHGRVPPQALDLEEVVLGGMMLEKDAVNTVIDILHPEAFYKDAHQKIFNAIKNLFSRSEPIDLLTVTNALRSSGELDIIGGAYYISQLTNRVVSAANIEFHARIILQKFIQRELIRISSDIIKDAYEDTTDVFDLLDKAESGLFSVSETNLRRSFSTMPDLVHAAIADIENAKNSEGEMRGVPS
ncbi:MAG: replicative DNA helicase, partial [Bacteroidales bacterium]|nr:replicative DNA helicase [Bacteroidales bacterium]